MAQTVLEGQGRMFIEAMLIGLAAGVLVGLLGIGGGTVLVPALVYLLHVDQHLAQGTSLFVLIPPLGLGALVVYWRRGNVDLAAGILSAVGILLGADLGGRLAVHINSRDLQGFFGLFMMLAAVILWRKATPEMPRPAGRDHG
jgi:hypothetical protein